MKKNSNSSEYNSSVLMKICQICSICAIETTLFVVSTGNACVDSIIHKIIYHGESESEAIKNHRAEHEAKACDLSKQYFDLVEQVEKEKKRGKELNESIKNICGDGLLSKPLEDLNLEELNTLKMSLLEFEGNVIKRREELLSQSSNRMTSSSPDVEAVDHLKNVNPFEN